LSQLTNGVVLYQMTDNIGTACAWLDRAVSDAGLVKAAGNDERNYSVQMASVPFRDAARIPHRSQRKGKE